MNEAGKSVNLNLEPAGATNGHRKLSTLEGDNYDKTCKTRLPARHPCGALLHLRTGEGAVRRDGREPDAAIRAHARDDDADDGPDDGADGRSGRLRNVLAGQHGYGPDDRHDRLDERPDRRRPEGAPP